MKEVHLSKFLKRRPLVFTSEDVGEDPQWFIERSEKACTTLGCSSLQKVELVTYQLQGKVNSWWTTWKGGRAPDTPQLMWEEFQKVFMERFIPVSVWIARAKEFENLKQVSMTVDEYDTLSIKLARYAPYMIHDERENIHRFTLSLHHHLCELVRVQMETCPFYVAVVARIA